MELALAALLIAYLPGALIFRLPVAGRERRAALDAGERVFWHVMLSVAWSLSVVLILAALDVYRFERLLWINAGLAGLLLAGGRRRLAFAGTARRPTWSILLPVSLIALGAWQFFPTSEYVIGGKDPGTYISEGVQIAQRGTLAIHDPVVAAVPDFARDLFFPVHYGFPEYSTRFMGFYLMDPRTGAVMGQFPHLFPASIAIGYGLDGLTGARSAVAVWAILGVLSVYFAGARFVGRGAAWVAAALLSANVITSWFARYPNAEVAMQALVFAALLAYARAHEDGDAFFAPVAGCLAGLFFFHRIDAPLGVAGMIAATALVFVVAGRRPRAGFLIPLAIGAILGWLYLSGPLRAYFAWPRMYVGRLSTLGVAAAGLASLAALVVLGWLRRRHGERTRTMVPLVIAAIVLAAAAYAWFLRQPGGRLTDYDAYALRTFTEFYVRPIVLAASLVGLVLVARREFWRDPAMVATIVGFSMVFFYKIRIVPIHFWAARRFVPVILPGILLLASRALVGPADQRWRGRSLVRIAAGACLAGLVAVQFLAAARPVRSHVEYAGAIPAVERLASSFGERDLVIVESRDTGSDVHTLALPLAYIYARNVLVLASAKPDKLMLRTFLEDAERRYERVLFLGGGGTDLLSRRIVATPVGSEQVRVPEYESLYNAYPRGVRRKDFDYGVFQLALGELAAGGFSLDVGREDELNVVRFFDKETTEGRTVRWTRATSYVAVPGLSGAERELVLVMHDGGRVKAAGPARVDVFFDRTPIATLDVASGFRPYRVALPFDLVRRAAKRDDPAELTLVSTVWRPRDFLGGSDDRPLGVMVDRVEIR
jgi:hypothetical protein